MPNWKIITQAWILLAAFGALSAAEEDAKTQLILFLGDSLTAGYGIDPAQAFPALIQTRINEKGWPFEVLNAGLSGETSAGGLRRINWMLRRDPSVLVLELGANDGLRGLPPEMTRRNLSAIVARARRTVPHISIVLAGMMVPPNLGPDYSEEFQTVFQQLAKEQGLTLIPFLLDGVGGHPELNQPDGIHPTPEGHRIIAETVWKALEPILKARLKAPDQTGK